METHSSSAGNEPETTAIRTDDIEVSSLGPVCLKVPRLILPSEYFKSSTPDREPNEKSKKYLQRVTNLYGQELVDYFQSLNMIVKSTFNGSVLYFVLNGKIVNGNAFAYNNCTVGQALQFIANLDSMAIVSDLRAFVPKTIELNIGKARISGGARHGKKRTRVKKEEITQFNIDNQLILDTHAAIKKFLANAKKLISTHEKSLTVTELRNSENADLLLIRARRVQSEMEKLKPPESSKITTWQDRDAACKELMKFNETLQTMIALLADAELPEDCSLRLILEQSRVDMTSLMAKITRTLKKLEAVPVITLLSFNSSAPKRDKRFASYLDRVIFANEVPNMSDDIVTAIQAVLPSGLSKNELVKYCLTNRLPIII